MAAFVVRRALADTAQLPLDQLATLSFGAYLAQRERSLGAHDGVVVSVAGAIFTAAAARQLADDLRRVRVLHADGPPRSSLGRMLSRCSSRWFATGFGSACPPTIIRLTPKM